MRILFVAATGPELKSVKSAVQHLGIKWLICDFFCSGVGNYATIFSLSKYLSDQSHKWTTYDFLINIWVCGHDGKPENLIQIWRIRNPIIQKETLVPICFEFANISSIFCSEVPVLDSQILEGPNCNYVDMESYGVEYVAHKYKIPRILLKVPYDLVGQETQDFDINAAIEHFSQSRDAKELVNKIVSFLK